MPGQRLLAKIDLFRNPEEVLSDPKYWNKHFARHFLDAWNDVAYLDPQAGFRLAEVGLELVERLPKRDQNVLYPYALAIRGSSFKTVGDYSAAEQAFSEARGLYESRELPQLDRAAFLRRLAYLRNAQKRTREALDFCAVAIDLCRAEASDYELGLALLARGTIIYISMLRNEAPPPGEPLKSFTECLGFIAQKRCPYAFEAATRHIGLVLLEEKFVEPVLLKRALRHIKRAEKLQSTIGITKRTLASAQLRWTKGLVWQRVPGAMARAEELLLQARRTLKNLESWKEVVLIDLDLIVIALEEGRWGRVRQLTEEILRFEDELGAESVAAVTAWHECVLKERGSDTIWRELLVKVRGLRGAHRHSLCAQKSSSTRRSPTRYRPYW